MLAAHMRGIRRHIVAHMRGSCRFAESISEPVEPWQLINVHMALEALRDESGTSLLTYKQAYFNNLEQLIAGNPARGGGQYDRLSSGVGESVERPTNAVYLLNTKEHPFIAMIQGANAEPEMSDFDEGMVMPGTTSLRLQVLARTHDAARQAIELVRLATRNENVYRGKTITVSAPEAAGDRVSVRFHSIRAVDRDQLILPADRLDVLDRNVIGFARHSETLRRAGRSVRRGVLLHGPPGVGKTMAISYLVNACPDHTVVLLTGRNLRYIRESMMFARLLAPTIVILEDVDLVARERSDNQHGVVLHELLDELDGMGEKTDCITLLTTNRPDILEPALAGRPGRVDQAIEFPLPDDECRRRLVLLYGADTDLSQVAVDDWVEKTEGVSPAFISEWLRKAVLIAAERGETTQPLRLTDNDFDESLRELVLFGGQLTQSLLGYRMSSAE
ncbi:MAG: ATP-binding protein [Pirellulaceae bacterium]|nr:ATP-binding protein [Pirellulaceae bacterium]MDP7017601.1 ATP-binding protein [Pirellulaceae bacterium]